LRKANSETKKPKRYNARVSESIHKLSPQVLFTPPIGLPVVSIELNNHIQNITHALEQLIRQQNNFLSFSDYMRFCLYHPELGYYSSGLQKFGEDGDFTTAPEISPLFGKCIAQAIAPLLLKNKDWSICELGPGRGALAETIIKHLDELNALPQSYQLLEVSASLHAVQKKRLEPLHDKLDIKHLQTSPKNFKGIILGNEIIDALTVERFYINSDAELFQLGVSIENEALIEVASKAPQYLIEAIKSLDLELPNDFKSDICVQLKPWLQEVIQHCDEAVVLFSDYGFSQSEYYSSERKDGTLRCHYRQHAHNNFLTLPALQDLTAWVDFTALANAALDLELNLIAYSTQAHVLLGSGYLQQIDFESLSEKQRFQTSKQIQTLTLPASMGERFRFMQLNKNCDDVIPALQLRDLRHQL